MINLEVVIWMDLVKDLGDKVKYFTIQEMYEIWVSKQNSQGFQYSVGQGKKQKQHDSYIYFLKEN